MYSNRQHTPVGVNDILKAECKLKRNIEKAVTSVFESFAYDEIETPSFEYLSIYQTKAGGIDEKLMYKFFDNENRILALRPDITTSIARVCATKLKDELLPQRFFYVGNSFRAGEAYGEMLREFTQAGVELVGVSNPLADAEVIAVTINALLGAGLEDFMIEIGQVAFFKGLVEQAGISEKKAEQIRILIDKKDTVALEQLVDSCVKEESVKKILTSLPMMFGFIDILDDIDTTRLNQTSRDALENIRTVYEILKGYGLGNYISIDLGMVSQINYYSGIIFKGFARGTGFTVCGGGRYDTLIGEFGKSLPATGVAIGINRLTNLLYAKKASNKGLVPIALVASDLPDLAYRVSFGLRAQGLRVESYVLGGTMAEAIDYCELKGITALIWVGDQKVTMTNILSGEVSETTLEKLLNSQK